MRKILQKMLAQICEIFFNYMPILKLMSDAREKAFLLNYSIKTYGKFPKSGLP